MRCRRSAVCSIIPPHILRNIAERGDSDARRKAYDALELSASMRGAREVQTAAPPMLAAVVRDGRRTVYDARHARKLPGRIARREDGAAVKDVAVNEAWSGAGRTRDFFRRVHGRSSIDGEGMPIESTVHFGVRYENAQWDGRRMIYGDGDGRYFERFTKSLEVIGHELAHGVTQYSAALDYHDQPGALNEHFSDVFGILVRQWARRETAAKSDWLVGKGLFTKKVIGVAVRSMRNPGTAYDDPILGRDPQPAHMRDFLRTDADSGGVHVNSGIPNRAFCELALMLGGRAWEVAGKIWYHALTTRVRRQSRFRDCANATFRSAGDLYGSRSTPQLAVLEAWKQVGVEVTAAHQ